MVQIQNVRELLTTVRWLSSRGLWWCLIFLERLIQVLEGENSCVCAPGWKA